MNVLIRAVAIGSLTVLLAACGVNKPSNSGEVSADGQGKPIVDIGDVETLVPLVLPSFVRNNPLLITSIQQAADTISGSFVLNGILVNFTGTRIYGDNQKEDAAVPATPRFQVVGSVVLCSDTQESGEVNFKIEGTNYSYKYSVPATFNEASQEATCSSTTWIRELVRTSVVVPQAE